MATAIDTTATLTTAKLGALRAAGVTCVSRYLCHSTDIGKEIKPAEARLYPAEGMQLLLNWEQAAQSLWTESAATISAWAKEATADAVACGYRAGNVLPVSVDFNVSPAQWAKVSDNLGEFDAQLRQAGMRAGIYGSGYACRRAREDGVAVMFWRSMSTAFLESSGNPAAYIHLRQLKATTVAGVSCDTNTVLLSDFGQIGRPTAPTPPPVPPPPPPVSEDIMGVIAKDAKSGQYYLCIGGFSHPIDAARVADIRYLAGQGVYQLTQAPKTGGAAAEWTDGGLTRLGWSEAVFGPVWQPPAAVTAQVDASAVAAALAGDPGFHAAVVADVQAALRAGTGG